MRIFERIKQALEDNVEKPFLQFLEYKITALASPDITQQGLVVKAENKIKTKFAIKFYNPTVEDIQLIKESRRRFIDEINILKELDHRNIVKIIDGGKAWWDESEKKWAVDVNTTKSEDEYLFYIMDYIEGKDISFIFPELCAKYDSKNPAISTDLLPLPERLKLFEELIFQISDAIYYYHFKNIAHKDLKATNIIYSKNSEFIIVDFGFAAKFNCEGKLINESSEVIIKTDEMDYDSIREDYYKPYDLCLFAQMLKRILPSFKDIYDKNRYRGISTVLNKATNADLNKRFKNALEFRNKIKDYFIFQRDWRFDLQLNQYMCPDRFGMFSFKIRIPASGSILFTNEVKSIIDTYEFQRLRGIRQLGPTIFVFPGANHTRYEHSLGAYYLSLKYIERLVNLSYFRDLCDPLEENIRLIVLSALLHDIGHYPYSHLIEEFEELPNNLKIHRHEDNVESILCGPLKGIIESKWNIEPSKISNIISGRRGVEELKGVDAFINTIIDSPIDVDKIDYLIRDSIHCGVRYGDGIDIERFLDSLWVDERAGTKKKICLTNKGESCLLSILTCRNIMYKEVYWHKTVNSFKAMFKRFFYKYIESASDSKDANKIERNIRKSLARSDEMFINYLYNSCRDDLLKRLITPFVLKKREVYKPLYIYSKTSARQEEEAVSDFFDKILTDSYKCLLNKSEKLSSVLNRYVPGIKLGSNDIIIEKMDTREGHEKYDIDKLLQYNIRKERYEAYPSALESLNKFLEDNVQAYIFCNPDYYETLKELPFSKEWESILTEIT
jgi:HD superfamily phosphohydrolase/tRNA A-37 threonylcarbamoyl transferase component Bud32